MKDLTIEELEKAPHEIAYLYLASIHCMPVGSEIIDRCMKDHPEYFPAEILYQDKWDAIPEEVHEAFKVDLSEVIGEFIKCNSGGLIEFMNLSEGERATNVETFRKHQQIEEDLWQKHYKKFNL